MLKYRPSTKYYNVKIPNGSRKKKKSTWPIPPSYLPLRVAENAIKEPSAGLFLA